MTVLRRVVASLGALACAAASMACAREGSIAPRMNVVVIQTDDQRADTLRVMPNVRRLLGGHGMTFSNSFVSTPLCCPSRASLLTGQYSSTHGVFDNAPPRGGVRAFDDDSTLATWLKDAGYTTSFVGKYLNGYELLEAPFVAPGWDDWHAYRPRAQGAYFGYDLYENGRTTHFGRDDAHYLTDVMADRATAFIEEADDPFFSYIAPFAPHFPVEPARRDAEAFAGDAPHRPPSYDVAVRPGNPGASLPPLSSGLRSFVDRQDRAGRASLLAVDRAVAQVVRAVAKRRKLSTTVFIFTSDNGFLLGEHRIATKHWAYEPSIRVPLVIRAPWIQTPRTDARMVLNVDLAPTIAELARIDPGLPPDGVSLVPLLRSQRTRWRDGILIEFYGTRTRPIIPPPYKAVRTNRYKLIVYANGDRELYDLAGDPDELNDIAEEPSAADIVRALRERLEELRPGWPRGVRVG